MQRKRQWRGNQNIEESLIICAFSRERIFAERGLRRFCPVTKAHPAIDAARVFPSTRFRCRAVLWRPSRFSFSSLQDFLQHRFLPGSQPGRIHRGNEDQQVFH
jgi:hypothetical protein